MTAFRLYLDKRSQRKDGTYPLKIAINHHRVILLSLKVYTTAECFIGGEVIIPGDKFRQRNINEYVHSRLVQVENTINRLRLLGQLFTMSDKDLKRLLETERIIEDEKTPLFLEQWRNFVSRKSEGAKRVYDLTESKLNSYCNLESLTFEMINTGWLRKFDEWMYSSCSTNTRSIHMRNIRAVFNYAINEDIIQQNLYPFRKFKIKTEKTRKRSMTVEELKQFRDHPCEPHQEKYRDIFMLIFYLIGINIVDLLNATSNSLKGGRLEYKRAKTGRLYSIKVEPEAMQLIEKYKGKKYLLSIMDTHKNYRDFTKKLNSNLKEIGTFELVPRKNGKPGPPKRKYIGLFPELTTYWARHTWATIAASLDIPKETIAAGLGHGGDTVTDIYIDFDQKKVDEANRKVIDYFNSYTTVCFPDTCNGSISL